MRPKEMKRKNGGSTLSGSGDGETSSNNSSQCNDSKSGKENKSSGGGGKSQRGANRSGYFVFDDHSFYY